MKTIITVTGKRWFQKSFGNTYHSTKVNIHNVETGETKEYNEPFMYGYGDQYRETATKILNKNTEILKNVSEDNRKYGLTYWGVLEELENKGIKVVFNCQDVNRKKDL